jgi:hypothetical protein
MEYGIYGTVAAFATVIGHAIRVTLSLKGIEQSIRSHYDAQIDKAKADIVNRTDTLRREFGETASALRTKIHEIETWNRDTFVRKDSFEIVIGRIEKSMEKIGDRVDEKLDKIDSRIEMLVARDKS